MQEEEIYEYFLTSSRTDISPAEVGYFVEVLTVSTEVFLFCVFIALCVYFLRNKGKYRLPPGPVGLPILGYLPFLKEDPVVEFTKLSKKYGDVFSLYLGRRYVVVVTDVMKAKELLSKQSTADRPDNMFMLLPDGAGFGEENGKTWTEQRRYCIKEMKNLGLGTSNWEKLLEEEITDFLDMLKNTQGKPKDISKELSASISNNVLSLVSGQRLPTGHPKRNIIDKGIESFELLFDQSGLIINYPTLFKFCVKYGLINADEKVKHMEDMNKCFRSEIDKLRQEKDGSSFIHRYFAEIEKNEQQKLRNSFNDENLIGNVQALVIAGSDTTRVSLFWLFLAMASYPRIQEKVHEEIDAVLGKDGKVSWAERNKLPYCLATITEGQRWRTVAPLNVMHRTNDDVAIDDYVIPKGTDIITMIYAFHNDPRYWKNPDAFLPERFISEDGRLKEPEGYMPFSHGKRICPGKTVALIEAFDYFVSIMQKFRILPASDNTPPDIVGVTGLTLQPKRQSLRYVLR